jgi:hypothetical protein
MFMPSPMATEFAKGCITSLYLDAQLDESTLIQMLLLCKGIKCLVLLVIVEAFTNDASSLWHAMDHLPLTALTLDSLSRQDMK